MNINELPDGEIKNFKKELIENGTIFEKDKIKSYDAKYFEKVTVSNILIKFFLFFSLGIYTIINFAGIVLSIVFNSYNLTNPLATIIGVLVIDFIVFAIFNNINTNKKKEENAVYIKDDKFIFNFTDGVSETPKLFYSLSCDSVKKIEFLIYSLRKGQLFGSVTFTFQVLDYEVTHSIRFTNLTKIEQMLESKFPLLLHNLFIDGKNPNYTEPIKSPKRLKYIFVSLALFVASILLTVIPIVFNYYSIALIVAGVILFVTSMIVFSACFICLFSLVPGAIVSAVFIIMGICLPIFIIENSSASFLDNIIQNPEILMPTVFCIIGLCLFVYTGIIVIGKLCYVIKRK